MRYGSIRNLAALGALVVTLMWASQPVAAQKQAVKRGQGEEVTRTQTSKRGVETVRGNQRGEAARGRTSGRADRTSSREDRVVVTRDGRQEQVRGVVVRRDDDRDDRYDDDWHDDDYDRRRGSDRGPKFCQTGQGHPVFGMSWCYDKGFGGRDDRLRRSRDWEDIIIGRPDRRTRTVNQRGIGDILGDVVLGQMNELRLDRNLSGVLNGRWLDSNGASILRVSAGSTPLAEFVDRNRDGRADLVRIK